ncbi:MAG: hypothetical protein J6Y31_05745 [Bacteroidales bacterium]|nr:hypothetical protein [Bacteroidales bacterium]
MRRFLLLFALALTTLARAQEEVNRVVPESIAEVEKTVKELGGRWKHPRRSP